MAVLKPALGSSASPGQPILLASIPASDGRGGALVFRGPDPASRPPQPAGVIVSIEDGLATINLGSLDGIKKGSVLTVFRDEKSTRATGRFVAMTVFRERARGEIAGQQVAQDYKTVRVADADQVAALMGHVEVLVSRGDSRPARDWAEKAVALAETTNIPLGERQKAWEMLALLETQAGSLQAAERHYQLAIDSLDAESRGSFEKHSSALNNLAVLRMLRGDYDAAAALLTGSASASNKPDGRSLNNRGVLAELRGDRRSAEALYTDAQHAFAGGADSSGHERRVVETNLARIKGPK
ncbi:MAG: hypothetical protein HYX27_00145 [Acidobacteria bacterium]|nr:hypothetical protein [Acidobacteriota bacterium]